MPALSGPRTPGFADDIAGLRSILDPNVPTNVGAGANEDRIVAVRLEDLILLEQLLLTDVDIAVANVGVLGAHGTVNLTQGLTQALRGPRWTDETRMESEADARTRTGDPFSRATASWGCAARSRLSPAEPKPVVKHLRVVEEKTTVVGGENQAEICRAAAFCGLVYRVLHSVDFKRDHALAASRSAAQ